MDSSIRPRFSRFCQQLPWPTNPRGITIWTQQAMSPSRVTPKVPPSSVLCNRSDSPPFWLPVLSPKSLKFFSSSAAKLTFLFFWCELGYGWTIEYSAQRVNGFYGTMVNAFGTIIGAFGMVSYLSPWHVPSHYTFACSLFVSIRGTRKSTDTSILGVLFKDKAVIATLILSWLSGSKRLENDNCRWFLNARFTGSLTGVSRCF